MSVENLDGEGLEKEGLDKEGLDKESKVEHELRMVTPSSSWIVGGLKCIIYVFPCAIQVVPLELSAGQLVRQLLCPTRHIDSASSVDGG
jgi:hypothetical protein